MELRNEFPSNVINQGEKSQWNRDPRFFISRIRLVFQRAQLVNGEQFVSHSRLKIRMSHEIVECSSYPTKFLFCPDSGDFYPWYSITYAFCSPAFASTRHILQGHLQNAKRDRWYLSPVSVRRRDYCWCAFGSSLFFSSLTTKHLDA